MSEQGENEGRTDPSDLAVGVTPDGADVYDHTETQTMRALGGELSLPTPGMAALEVRNNMPVFELLQIETRLPNDAVRITSVTHPERDDMMVLFYTSQLFPAPGEGGVVAPIEVSWNDQNQMLVRVKEIPHAEQQLEAGPNDGQDRS